MNKYQTGSEFLSNMSHEVRTPLNVIIGMCDIAMRHLDDRTKVESCLRKINVAGDHLIGLVNNLLDITKADRGCIDIQNQEFEIDDLIEELRIMTETSAERKSLVFNITANDVVNRRIISDYGHLLRTLVNIVSNAVKYTPEGGYVKAMIREESSSDPSRATYVFTCEDNGIGMSEEFIRKIYEPFARADDIHVNRTNGSGLGMAIVRKIVDALDGNIEIESKKGDGTSVKITFSFEVSGQKKNIDEIRTKEHDLMNDKKVVIVAEDQIENREVLMNYLEDLNIEAATASNGEEAVDLFIGSEEGMYKAVFMDIEMPVLDGYQASMMIRGMNRSDSDIPIIALTANAFQSDREKAMRSGINYYLTKPLKMDALLELLNETDTVHLL